MGNHPPSIWKSLLAAGASLALCLTMACGGGGGGSNAGPSTPGAVSPAFTLQPANQVVTEGQNATFLAMASGNPSPTYQWEHSPDGTNWTAISGATQASYTFMVQTTDNGAQFRVIASNSAGSATSGVAMLAVTPTTTPTIPTFTQQPQSLTVSAGVDASFTAAASGSPFPTYQWERNDNGTTWTSITGATSATYTLVSAQAADNGAQFRALAINDQGMAISSVAVLTVTGGGTYSILGKVVDSSNVGLSSVTVTFMGTTAGSCATDANGNYVIPGLANGSYVLTPSKTGYAFSPLNQAVTVNGADIIGLNFIGSITSPGTGESGSAAFCADQFKEGYQVTRTLRTVNAATPDQFYDTTLIDTTGGTVTFNGRTAIQIFGLSQLSTGNYEYINYMSIGVGSSILHHGSSALNTQITFDPPRIFNFDLLPGQTFTQTYTGYLNGIPGSSQTVVTRYMGRETVTVPAGTFSTCHFEYVISSQNGSIYTQNAWWAIGNGLAVKQTDNIVDSTGYVTIQTISLVSANINGINITGN